MDINQPVQNQQNQESSSVNGPACCGGSKKSSLVGIIVILVVAGGVFAFIMFQLGQDQLQPQAQNIFIPKSNQSAQTSNPPAIEDSTAAIGQQLNDINVTDIDSQFKDIDADLNQL